MKQLIFRLAWARFRSDPSTKFDVHLKDCWRIARIDAGKKKRKLVYSATPNDQVKKIVVKKANSGPSDLIRHLPDSGRSAKHSSVYRQANKNGSLQVLGGTKSEMKSMNRITNRRKVETGNPKGFFSSQRFVGELNQRSFPIK